jgi:riboflavin kinase/FMN adenylyltransferase
MKVVHGVDALDASLGRLFVVIGVFDGLHRGHLYLLEKLREAATAHGAEPAVITFDHHPDEVITGNAPALLCDPDERLERLEAAGVAVTVVQTFDVALRMTPFEAFVQRISDRVDLAGFLMTPESAFGHDRGGTPETVAALGRELGYDVLVVPSFALDGRPVRSSDIRDAIASGDLAMAARLLGHGYGIVGMSGPEGAGPVELVVPMPVALPPPGTYPVQVRRAEAPDRSATTATVTVTGQHALLIDGPAPIAGGPQRLRIVFR